jgi:NAD(P)-dependent dehydrogenase (short-subunit alcohol dehydrogenase family)
MENPVALVTGVTSGIGSVTAQALAERGWRVFGTARSEASALPPGVERVLLDVRDAASVEAGVREVLAKVGRVDLLVNNAGGTVMGAVEETSVQQAQELFDVNFFGAVRLTQAVLPAMRAQRSGRIVFISSVLGLMPAPFMGFYAATKHALEGLAESLDHETRGLGVRAALVEPSWMRTRIDSSGTPADRPVADYAQARDRARAGVKASVDSGDDPGRVAEAVLEAATAPRPRLRYLAGAGASRLARLRRFLPASFFDAGVRKAFRLDGGQVAPVT